MSTYEIPDLGQAVAVTTIAGAAFAAGRMRERVAALSRHVTAELQRFSRVFGARFDALEHRMTALEAHLFPHVLARVAAT